MKQYKISLRLTLSFFLILGLVFVGLLSLTHVVLPDYYGRQVDGNVEKAMKAVKAGSLSERRVGQIEEQYGVTIVTSHPDALVLDDLNGELLLQLSRKGIALNRFWLTEESLTQLHSVAELTRNFDQGKQKSSFLTKIALIEDQVVVVGTSMAYFSETATIMSRFFFMALGLILLVGMALIYVTTNRLLKPLTTIKESAEKIAAFEYVTIPSYPANELGELAQRINEMSRALKQNQARLQQQNQQIRQLTADLTHELKTPIAVIQAYASGIEDGLDDGTYHQVILQQAEDLNGIVEDMLQFSKTSQLDFPLTELDVLSVLQKTISQLEPLASASHQRIKVTANFDWQQEPCLMMGNDYLLGLAFDNLISNGLRYGNGPELRIALQRHHQQLECQISNDIADGSDWAVSDIEELWQPFVVGKDSRNKDLVGTGLGLSIVANVLRQHQTTGQLVIEDQQFSVVIIFKLTESTNR